MAKSLIRNKIADRTFGFLVSADSDSAKTFCDSHLEGTYEIYESKSKSGSDIVADCNRVVVTGKDTGGHKATFSFYAKNNLSEDEIRAQLKDKTYNQVKFDEVYIISMQKIKIGI